MRHIFLFLFILIGIGVHAQKIKNRQNEVDSISNLIKLNNEKNTAFLKAVDSNIAVKAEYDQAIYYAQKGSKKVKTAGRMFLLSSVGLIVTIAAAPGTVAIAGVSIFIASATTADVFLFNALSNALKSRKHMMKAYELAGVDCPCMRKKKRR